MKTENSKIIFFNQVSSAISPQACPFALGNLLMNRCDSYPELDLKIWLDSFARQLGSRNLGHRFISTLVWSAKLVQPYKNNPTCKSEIENNVRDYTKSSGLESRGAYVARRKWMRGNLNKRLSFGYDQTG